MTKDRDIEADYRNAYIAEYKAHVRAGRTGDAKIVAKILRDSYGHDVDEPASPAPKKRTARKETTKAAPKPEKTVES